MATWWHGQGLAGPPGGINTEGLEDQVEPWRRHILTFYLVSIVTITLACWVWDRIWKGTLCLN